MVIISSGCKAVQVAKGERIYGEGEEGENLFILKKG
jgi:CRP-like cAMP-binding protein